VSNDFSSSKIKGKKMKYILSILFVLIFSTMIFAQEYLKYTIQINDTYKSISEKVLKDPKMFNILAMYNGIRNYMDIQPGKILKIPYSISIKRIAKISIIRGDVKNEFGRQLLKNDYLVEGSKVTTKNGQIEIILDEGTIIRVGKNTNFILNNYSYDDISRNTNVKLNNGKLEFKVTKLTENSQFNVSTISAVAGVRGTYFYINYDKNTDESSFAVYNGSVVVSNEKESVIIESGFATCIKNTIIEKPFLIPAKIEWIE
jgi:hypothetical protein